MSINPHRGEVAFDLFVGKDGYETIEPGDLMFRLTNDDIARIIQEVKAETIKGLGSSLATVDPATRQQILAMELGIDSPRDLAVKIQGGNTTAITACLMRGVRWARDKEPFKAGQLFTQNKRIMAEPPFGMTEAQQVVAEAFIWIVHGKTWQDMVDLAMKADQEKKAKGGADDGGDDPLNSSGGNSPTEQTPAYLS